MTSKTCYKCHETKTIPEFKIDSRAKGHRSTLCKACHNKEGAERYKRNPEKHKQRNRLDYEKNKSRHRDYQLKKLYGISIEKYNSMFDEQNGCCAICKQHQTKFSQSLSTDHDHETGEVRKLLCCSCNQFLGQYEKRIKNGLMPEFDAYLKRASIRLVK